MSAIVEDAKRLVRNYQTELSNSSRRTAAEWWLQLHRQDLQEAIDIIDQALAVEPASKERA